ncbi:nuclease A inhibitor family protein [Floridanema evergladense]|uniref:Nuclease A inhibitor family protein n=1 Tax=Floridaenema evergladense BLCC-F167 TaxID=3153639 RepID=A0ABV4WIJ2_9CYAN
MKPEIAQIVATLEMLTDGLYYSLVGDEPYKIVTWEIEENGEFTFENFLKNIEALIPISGEDFLKNIENLKPLSLIAEYKNLVDLLQSHLVDLQVYSYCFPKLPSGLFASEVTIFDETKTQLIKGVPVIIGATSTGEWIGLAPKQYNTTESSPEFNIPEITVSEAIANLTKQLQEITNSLAYPLREYELTKVQPKWAIALTNNRRTIIEKILDGAQFTDIRSVNSFLRIRNPEYETSDKELKLNQFFNSELTDSKVYNLDFVIAGEHLTIHYLLGKTTSNDWVGVVTNTYTC